jgi:hypothetical protein
METGELEEREKEEAIKEWLETIPPEGKGGGWGI